MNAIWLPQLEAVALASIAVRSRWLRRRQEASIHQQDGLRLRDQVQAFDHSSKRMIQSRPFVRHDSVER